ncbi:hypothetical protein [Ferrimonas marina]|uniref:Uncharacterized protein n=1 Tax=Ferrimonas marina TaxID=299255 RepID=A0A1M5TBW1_9GAMM|nr:hypothetical protein [Ferrimonas marina]SHH48194.1 hypothetical protein SAMN02745129_2076 [Ferrimonas marina]
MTERRTISDAVAVFGQSLLRHTHDSQPYSQLLVGGWKSPTTVSALNYDQGWLPHLMFAADKIAIGLFGKPVWEARYECDPTAVEHLAARDHERETVDCNNTLVALICESALLESVMILDGKAYLKREPEMEYLEYPSQHHTDIDLLEQATLLTHFFDTWTRQVTGPEAQLQEPQPMTENAGAAQ